MAKENKTKKTAQTASAFLNTVKDPEKRKDGKKLLRIMKDVTGKKPVMWGSSIVGFDEYSYTYASGHAGTWPMTGFSPRAQNLTVYLMLGFEKHKALLKKLGPHKTGKSCLYIKRLSDIDEKVLKTLIQKDYEAMKKKYKTS